MASSSQFPQIQFGDVPPETVSLLKNAAKMQHPYTPRPLSPQLRFSVTQKLPRIPPPRTVSQPLPPHPTLSTPPVVNRSFVSVPANWCNANRITSRDTYLSRNLLLVKMYERTNLYRSFISNDTTHKKALRDADANVEVLGSPVDYFLSFPLKALEFNQPPPPLLEGANLRPNQEVSHAWAYGPVKSTRNTLNRQPCTGLQPHGGRQFPWVANSTGTKMYTLRKILSTPLQMVTGFVECPKCGKFWGIGYGLKRYSEAVQYVWDKKEEIAMPYEGNQVLRRSHFNCKCDGKKNAVRPFISDDFGKINWMGLLLGYGLGYCTVNQLEYFCRERKLPTKGDKDYFLLRVCNDLIQQIDAEIYVQ